MDEQVNTDSQSYWVRLKDHFKDSFSGGLIYQRRHFGDTHISKRAAVRRRNAYRYVLIALCGVVVPIAIYNFYTDQMALAAVATLVAGLYAANIFRLSRNLEAFLSPTVILGASLALVLLSAHYGQSYTMFWVYPLLVVMPVITPLRAAKWLGAMCAVLITPIIFLRVDAGTGVVICMSMLLTWLISAWTMYAVGEQSKKLKNMAVTDPLTGAYNRRHFEIESQQSFDHWQRNERPASLLLIDVDYFKRINDKFGHSVGDTALQKLVKAILSRVRNVDTVCRYGGEEFAILLIDTTVENALRVAEDIRERVEALRLVKSATMTISIGVCDVTDVRNLDHWLNLADAALFLAKKNGRNRVELAISGGAIQDVLTPDRTVPDWR